MQEIVLKYHLYGLAADLCEELTKEQLKSENGVAPFVNAIYQRDALSVISEAFDGMNVLLTTRYGQTLILKSFEPRFSTAVTKFNSLSRTTKLSQCITELVLLSSSSIEHSQRVSVLAAAATNKESFNEQTTNDEFLSAATYKQASFVKNFGKASALSTQTFLASSAETASNGNRSRNCCRRLPSNAAPKECPAASVGIVVTANIAIKTTAP